jgi:hypothetical protein
MTTTTVTPITFAVIYTALFFGYMISPVHPCVGVSLEYFKVPMKSFIKLLIVPTSIVFAVTLVLSFFMA